MRNRTVLGIICMVLAVIMVFVISPFMNKVAQGSVSCVRLTSDIQQGEEITKDDIEIVSVSKKNLPSGVVRESSKVIGKYAASALYTGDYLTSRKLSNDANTAKDVFANLDGSKIAVSVTIDTFAAGLSGKLQNGDIVSFYVYTTDPQDSSKKISSIPSELKYVKVITTTTSGGIDQDAIVEEDDGSYELPSTITVLANDEQAKLLTQYESDGNATLSVALVFRGDVKTAKQFLEKQDEYFEEK